MEGLVTRGSWPQTVPSLCPCRSAGQWEVRRSSGTATQFASHPQQIREPSRMVRPLVRHLPLLVHGEKRRFVRAATLLAVHKASAQAARKTPQALPRRAAVLAVLCLLLLQVLHPNDDTVHGQRSVQPRIRGEGRQRASWSPGCVARTSNSSQRASRCPTWAFPRNPQLASQLVSPPHMCRSQEECQLRGTGAVDTCFRENDSCVRVTSS
mmetsp:Transcript_45462/g.120586  ORF Transcript_45462/g.120586 Transcript_45462/m.120586 type:complete len:210 (+) Transcript_45462:2330-2959(+)